MSQRIVSSISQVSRHRLSYLSATVGGLVLSLALGVGCSSNSDGGGAGGSSTGGSGSGGKTGSGGTSASGGTTTSTGGAGSGGVTGSGGKTGSGGSGSGGKTGSGGASSTGGSGSGGQVTTGGAMGDGGSTGAGGGPGRDGGPGREGGVGGSQGSGGSTGGVDAGSTSGGQSAGCGKAPTLASNQYNNGNPISITVNGSQRRYILQVPTNYDNTKPYKLLLGIHALNSNDKSVYSEKYYGLQPLSNNTMIFAAPNGVQNGGSPCSGTGTGDSGCGWPAGSNNMELMDAVVKQVTDNFCIDMDHIYASGWSYGASMSYEVGCERPLGGTKASWGVRAIAIYAVRQMSGSCKPSIPIGYYLSHGINDSVLPYDTGVSNTQAYAKANGCTWATPPRASGSHICTNLSGCKAGYPLEFCSFVGDHTAYPDNGSPSSSWGPAEVWKFLSQF
jgi:poly(3-hydroxybutyrate) depolymerase